MYFADVGWRLKRATDRYMSASQVYWQLHGQHLEGELSYDGLALLRNAMPRT